MSKKTCTLTAESVRRGHPDKLCDQIADGILDAYLRRDPDARVAVEVMATNGRITINIINNDQLAGGNMTSAIELLTGGGTDAGAIAQSRGGVPSGVLSIPCRYVHSAAETVDLSDMEAGVKTLVEYLSH